MVPLTATQTVARWLYLVGQHKLSDLDEHIRRDGALDTCPSLYYLLHDHNGGKDPTASDPADRWSTPAAIAAYERELADRDFRQYHERPAPPFQNRTADCVAAVAWGGGWDRYQPVRFDHVPGYDGWINTDSMRWDARGPARCFRRIPKPTAGAMIVYASDPEHHSHGVPVGHVGGIVGYTLSEWNAADPACWDAIKVVNIAAYRDPSGAPAQANQITTGRGWYGKDAYFVVSVMRP